MVREGDPAPGFTLPSDSGQDVSLSSLKGKWVVLYFYPKDNTPGCTIEAKRFSENLDAFEEKGAVVMGVSADSFESHCKFRDKHDLRFRLLSDTEKEVIGAYGSLKTKGVGAKLGFGIKRETFLIDPKGQIAKIWHKVSVGEHAKEVLDEIDRLS